MRRVLAAVALTAACSGSTMSPPASLPTLPSATAPKPSGVLALDVLTTGLDTPWGLAFLPGGDALVSERDSARVLRVARSGGPAREVARLAEVRPAGEGGLLGLAVSPSYDEDGWVYAYLTAADDNRIVRFRLGQQPEPVLTAIPKGSIHNGGRLAFGPDGNLYAGTGDTGDRSLAQDSASLGGKILRMTPDGKPVGGSLVFSTGHRNVQGLAFDDRGRLFASEFGQNRFDELNVVRAGDNGGWPEVEGPGDGGGRFAAPLVTWTTDEASPSGVAALGDQVYVAALRGRRLWRVPVGGGKPVALLREDFGRLRTVAVAPDGALWILTSNRDGRGNPVRQDDRILRLDVSATR